MSITAFELLGTDGVSQIYPQMIEVAQGEEKGKRPTEIPKRLKPLDEENGRFVCKHGVETTYIQYLNRLQ